MLFDTEKILTHQNNEKYLIDIVFFNTLINNINYELSYIYYKNINYDEFIRDKFKNMLRYYYFNKHEDKISKIINYNRNKNI